MNCAILALSILAATAPPSHPVPNYELMLIDPHDVVKITTVEKGDWLDIAIVLPPSKIAGLVAFTTRNIGKQAGFALLQKNKEGSGATIEPSWIFLKTPILDGIVHLHLPNPPHLDRKIRDHSSPQRNESVASAR